MAFEIKPVRKYDGAHYPAPGSRWLIVLKAVVISAVVVVGCGLFLQSRDARWFRPLEALRKAAGGTLRPADSPRVHVDPAYDVVLGVTAPVPPADLTPPGRPQNR